MILPLTQNGGPSPIGVSMRNAAQLAIDDSGPRHHAHGSGRPFVADGAAQAAQAEVGAGAHSSSGPCSPTTCVRRRGRQGRGKADDRLLDRRQRRASPGVYLLSFLIETYVDRDRRFASRAARSPSAILAPQNDYAQRRRSPSSSRRPDGSTRKSWSPRATRRASRRTAAQQVAAAGGQSTRCSFPSRPTPCRRSRTRSARPASRRSFSAPGSGTTPGFSNCRSCRAPGSPPRQRRLQRLRGDATGPSSTASRPRLATLAYDAVTLAGVLARNRHRRSARGADQPSGFNGADGVFRFLADGQRTWACGDGDRQQRGRCGQSRAAQLRQGMNPAAPALKSRADRNSDPARLTTCSAAPGRAAGGRRRMCGC